MSEKILRALMRLFAILAKADENSEDARSVVEIYLKQLLNKELVHEYLFVYDEFLNQQNESTDGEKKKRRLAVSSVKVIVICEQINQELTQKQKFIVLLNVIEFVCRNGSITEQEMEFVSTVSSSFNILDEEFMQCLQLALNNNIPKYEDSENFLLINSQKDNSRLNSKYFHSELFPGSIVVLHIKNINIYLFRYYGVAELFLNSQIIDSSKIYTLSQGSSIRSSKALPIYYSDIVSRFLKDDSQNKIVFEVKNIEYKFRSGKIGLRNLSFSENSGKLIGIMGGSGAGKSTLLNILNGNNHPSKGTVNINGINLHNEKKKLEGVVGFIPQDDLLIEELTVFQNLFYNSKLCFANYSNEQINQLVENMLVDLGLIETQNLKVGNSLEQTISGGQRKRLNIALELIREPNVLFVDEPTSGLSSRDSENIMDLLKELALKGKLVFVVIHQPSSDIFKMFDKLLLLDTGGYPIYNGNPVESVIYFKTLIEQVNANESECVTCGNVNPEQIFNIIEAKVLDENGNQTRNRRVSPKEWNEFYTTHNFEKSNHANANETDFIKNTFKKPNLFNQFKVFVQRDVMSKISDKQYLLINLLEAPLLALLLATLIKYCKNENNYLLSENKNLPAYLFMCVLVALFIGLTVSAEEIIKDRKILKRESFLNLSKGSYLFSKLLILFTVSAFQTITFIIIGNSILEIKGMYLDYWILLFSASCFANLLGLNISSAFNSAVTIYILIPFLLIPQILLSGVIVKFEELNPKISSQSIVPVWGDIMASRWAFEALVVNQFVNNDFEKQIYFFEKQISNSSYKKVYWYSKMNELVDTNGKEKLIENEVLNEMNLVPQINFPNSTKLSSSKFDEETKKELKVYFKKIKQHYSESYDNAVKATDKWKAKFQTSEQLKSEYQLLLTTFQNKKLEELVKNVSSDLDPCVEDNGHLVATGDPIFTDGSKEHFIRSHFFAPTKNVFGKQYSTYWINIIVIWGMSLFLFISLYLDMLRWLLKSFSAGINRVKYIFKKTNFS